MNGEMTHQSDLKYYHLFKNGACYEFALDVETSRKADEDLAQVDRMKVFQKLQKVLATARIKDVELPGVENAETAVLAQTPNADSKPSDLKASDAKLADTTVPESKTAEVKDEIKADKTLTIETSAADPKTEKAQVVVTPEQK
jgi:hypothetical protein